MYIVVKTCNYDVNETAAVMFTDKKSAIIYMGNWWKGTYDKALSRNNDSLIDEVGCYLEDNNAQVRWKDNAKINFYVTKDSSPRGEWL